MINYEVKKYHYFAVKNLSELSSLGWLRGKKEAIINNDRSFQNALDDSLNYQTTETHPERISTIKPYIIKYHWEGVKFPAGLKDWKKFEWNNKNSSQYIIFTTQSKNNKGCL